MNLMLFKLNYKIQSIFFFNLNATGTSQKNLSDPSTSPKCSWLLLKTLSNGRKFFCIPPHFDKNKFIADFKEKSKLFTLFLQNNVH